MAFRATHLPYAVVAARASGLKGGTCTGARTEPWLKTSRKGIAVSATPPRSVILASVCQMPSHSVSKRLSQGFRTEVSTDRTGCPRDRWPRRSALGPGLPFQG